jgi:hypothetical protein
MMGANGIARYGVPLPPVYENNGVAAATASKS